MKYQAKTLYNGLVSIRSDRVERAFELGEELEVSYLDQKQVFTLEQLQKPVHVSGPFISKFNGQKYSLNNYLTTMKAPKVPRKKKKKPVNENQAALF